MTTAGGVDEAIAHEVAATYVEATDGRDAVTVQAFTQMATETDRLFTWITRPDQRRPLRVYFTKCESPYRDDDELITAVRATHTLEVTTVAANRSRRHPLMENHVGGSYDRFRAVHDALGHARLQLGFDRNGEYLAWRAQERYHSVLARRALATELHGQHSVRWTTGEVAEPKAMLFDDALLRRTRSHGLGVTSGDGGGRHEDCGHRWNGADG
jgi:hypothetical protein